MVDFGLGVLAQHTALRWHEVPISAASRAFAPHSSFTACCHEIALGNTDMCLANTWDTPSRRLFTSFTGAVYTDEFLLIVPTSGEYSFASITARRASRGARGAGGRGEDGAKKTRGGGEKDA